MKKNKALFVLIIFITCGTAAHCANEQCLRKYNAVKSDKLHSLPLDTYSIYPDLKSIMFLSPKSFSTAGNSLFSMYDINFPEIDRILEEDNTLKVKTALFLLSFFPQKYKNYIFTMKKWVLKSLRKEKKSSIKSLINKFEGKPEKKIIIALLDLFSIKHVTSPQEINDFLNMIELLQTQKGYNEESISLITQLIRILGNNKKRFQNRNISLSAFLNLDLLKAVSENKALSINSFLQIVLKYIHELTQINLNSIYGDKSLLVSLAGNSASQLDKSLNQLINLGKNCMEYEFYFKENNIDLKKQINPELLSKISNNAVYETGAAYAALNDYISIIALHKLNPNLCKKEIIESLAGIGGWQISSLINALNDYVLQFHEFKDTREAAIIQEIFVDSDLIIHAAEASANSVRGGSFISLLNALNKLSETMMTNFEVLEDKGINPVHLINKKLLTNMIIYSGENARKTIELFQQYIILFLNNELDENIFNNDFIAQLTENARENLPEVLQKVIDIGKMLKTNKEFKQAVDIELLISLTNLSGKRTGKVFSSLLKYWENNFLKKNKNLLEFLSFYSLWIEWTDGKINKLINIFNNKQILKSYDLSGKDKIINFYNLLRDNKLFDPTEEFLVENGSQNFISDELRQKNVQMFYNVNDLIEHNNEALKLIDPKTLSKEKALSAIAETFKMLDSYETAFGGLPDIREKLSELEKSISSKRKKIGADEKWKISNTTNELTTLHDIIIFLHQESIKNLFDTFTSYENQTEMTGIKLKLKSLSTKDLFVNDLLSRSLNERYYSGIKFLRDFHLFEKFTPRGNNNLICNKKIFQFFSMGEHIAKLVIDLHSPQAGGHILFDFNENQNDRERTGNAFLNDVCGNDIRQMVVASVLKKIGMQVESKGLNVHAKYNRECNASFIKDLVDMYQKIFRLMQIMEQKHGILKSGFSFADTDIGDEYRLNKNKSLKDYESDDDLIQRLVQFYTNAIMENIDEYNQQQVQKEEAISKVFKEEGVSISQNTLILALEEQYQRNKSADPLDTLEGILADAELFEHAKVIGRSIEGFKNIFKWEKEYIIGEYELLKANIEIGYGLADKIFMMRNSRTGLASVGWLQKGPFNEIIIDKNIFYERMKTEGQYPVGDLFNHKFRKPSLNEFMLNLNKQSLADKENFEGKTSKGISVSEGVVDGEIVIYKRGTHTKENLAGKIAVVENLIPDDNHAISGVIGLIILTGGRLSHAATVAAQNSTPAVIMHNFSIKNDSIMGNYQQNIVRLKGKMKNGAGINKIIKIEKTWELKEGEYVQIDGKKGEINEIEAIKQNLLTLMNKRGIDYSLIQNTISQHCKNKGPDEEKLVKWLYKKAFNIDYYNLCSFLETAYLNYDIKGYKEELLMARKQSLTEQINNFISIIKSADNDWKIYAALSRIQNLLNAKFLSEARQLELKTQIVKKLKEDLTIKKYLVANFAETKQKVSLIEGTKDYYDLRDSDSLLIGNNGNKFALLSRFSRNPYPHLIDGKIPEGGIINDLLRKEFFETLIPYNNENITLNEAIQKILQSKGNLRGKGQKITQILSEINLNNHPLKEKIENIFLKKWAKNKATLLAVRSNAILIDGTIEDSQGTAGLFKTVLSVNKDNLFENVVEVWKSLYSHRALEFYDSIRKDLPLEQFVLKIGMPCMLLEQVNAEVSVFVSSVMPESFEEEKVIMTASLYQGEGIAQGNIPVDTFIIDKNGHVISDIREKNEAMYGDNESVGLRKIEVIPFLIRKALKKINEKLMPFIDRTELKERFKKQIKEPALTYEEIKKIAYIAKLIQNELGYPVQMELSLDENREINIFQIKIDHTIGVKEGQEYLRELMIDSLINEFKNSLVKLQKTKTFYEIVSEFSKILELWMKDIGNENIFNDEKTLNILMNEILDSEIIKGTPFAYQINRNSNEFRKAA